MLRRETLESIIKTKRAYPHEAVAMAQQLLQTAPPAELSMNLHKPTEADLAAWMKDILRYGEMLTGNGDDIRIFAQGRVYRITLVT